MRGVEQIGVDREERRGVEREGGQREVEREGRRGVGESIVQQRFWPAS
jgi:hypothetical protein